MYNNNWEKEKLINDEIKTLANEIFLNWDRDNEGIVFSDDILSVCGVNDVEFGIALARILCNDNTGRIYKDNLINVLKIILYGNIESKVLLFVKFMIRDTSGNISYETIQSYIKISNSKILNKLGFLDDRGNLIKDSLQYEDILELFTSIPDNRGYEAINIFCNQILRILTKRTRKHKTMSIFFPPDDSSITLSSSWNKIFNASSLKDIITTIQFSLSPPRFYIIFLICLQIFLWLYNFFYYYSHSHPITFCIAKGFGLNLRVLTMYLYFTMARSTLNMLSNIPYLKPLLFPGYNIPIHSFIGFCTLFHTFGHTLMHIIYQMKYRKNGFIQSFLQKSLLKLIFHGRYYDYNDNVLSGDGITGFILVAMIIIISITALYRGISSFCYTIFSHIHFLYFLWIIFITLHVPLLWPFFFTITIIFVLDRLYDYFFLTIHSTLAYSRPCNNGVTFLSIPYSQYSNHSVGSYYRIQIPEISSLEWHPFSLAGSKTSHHLSFFIASSGDWTSELYKLVSDPKKRISIRVKVQGPFYAPAKDALNSPTSVVLLVASGIGITPFFSVIATKVTDEYVNESDRELYRNLFEENEESSYDVNGESSTTFESFLNLDRPLLSNQINSKNSEVQTLHLIWTIRDAMELMFYIDYVYHLVKNQKHLKKPTVKVTIYLTGLGKKTDPEYMIAQTLFLLSVSNKLNDYLTIQFGRPNFNKLVDSILPDEIYYCGGQLLNDVIRTISYEKKIPFHSESFDTTDKNILNVWNEMKNKQTKSKQSFTSTGKKRDDSISTGYSYSKKHSSIFQ